LTGLSRVLFGLWEVHRKLRDNPSNLQEQHLTDKGDWVGVIVGIILNKLLLGRINYEVKLGFYYFFNEFSLFFLSRS
jgi:hypothetical protein